MALLLSGDFHGNAQNELTRITKPALIDTYGNELFDEIKYHVILGDGGFLWPGNGDRDVCNYKVLAARPFPVLSVTGNHEPVLGRKDLPEVDIGIGENVIPVNEKPFTAYLKRGKVYTIDGFKLLVLGGALSVDREFRKEGESWWENECWSAEEKEAVMDLLKRENHFDYVLSHTGPRLINQMLFLNGTNQYYKKFYDDTAFLNETIDGMITCKGWFCGHWHKDRYFYDAEAKREYRYLYYTTAVLKGEEVFSK